jgi:hypothetical protein
MLPSSLVEGCFQRFDRPLPLPASHPGYHRFHQPEDPEEPPLGRMTDLCARLRGNQLVATLVGARNSTISPRKVPIRPLS